MDWFWNKVDASGDCWIWTGTKQSWGYGFIRRKGYRGYAHRYAWLTLVGPIAEGLELDHLCRNVACVNPDHLEPVTHRVNLLRAYGATAHNARKTECLRGHPFNEANTYRRPDGNRNCRRCGYERARAAYRREHPARPPQTHCLRGHEFNEANTRFTNGERVCRLCQRVRNDAWRARQAGAVAS